MKRELVEHRITEIISFIDDKNLALALEENLKMFSENELETLLGFLESGDYSILYDLLKEKIDEYKNSLDKIKILKIKLGSEKKQFTENKEREKEKAEAENLINF